MKKILLLVILMLFSISNTFSYDLNMRDQELLDKIKPVLEKIYSEDSNRFDTILNRVDVVLPKLKTNTRTYQLISELKDIMGDIMIKSIQVEIESFLTLVKVIDGDTIVLKDSIGGEEITYRLIGIDAPETSALRFGEVEELGKESTEYMVELLKLGSISVEYDDSQGKIDQYERHLVYVFTGNINVNQEMIVKGYAKEYTYDKPYKYQSEFQEAESDATIKESGIWGLEEKQNSSSIYSGFTDTESDGVCNIKGNISSNDEKIYHYEGCQSYSKTKISLEKGERYFCTTKEAEDAGWRVAGNCN